VGSTVSAQTQEPTLSAGAVMSQAGAENFPVASRFLPRALRPHFMAVYGFARMVDDIGDEAEGDRLGQLDWIEGELDRAARGTATHPILVALTPTIRQFDLGLDPFRDLIQANRQDQTIKTYQTFDDLVAYCMLSAAPVGRIVLALLGASTPDRVERSDRVCIGLQVVEHLQDVAEDAAMGRVYLPLNDLATFGCPVDALLAPEHRRALCSVVAHEVGRCRELLADGGPLSQSLPGRFRLAVAAFSAGGQAALDTMERCSFDVVAEHCAPKRHRVVRRWLEVLLRPQRSRSGT
jgi:squalene synthase HpnC